MILTKEAIKALEFAQDAHRGQVDKAGHPFINHPIRVALQVATEGLVRLIPAALLHDVIEDTGVTARHLLDSGFSDDTVAIVELMTRQPGVSYKVYIESLVDFPTAATLKKWDILDNMNPERDDFPGRDSLNQRYREALVVLGLK